MRCPKSYPVIRVDHLKATLAHNRKERDRGYPPGESRRWIRRRLARLARHQPIPPDDRTDDVDSKD